MVRQHRPAGPPSWDPRLLSGLRPKTVALYQKAVATFLADPAVRCRCLDTVPALDEALVAFATVRDLSRPKLERLVAAVEAVLPQAKGKLVWVRALLRAWARLRPPRHSPPLPWRGAVAVAWHLALSGFPRLAGVALLQWAAGLRPSEALNLRQVDLLPPERNVTSPNVALLALGVRLGTKVGRPQCAHLSTREAPEAVAVVRAFCGTTAPDELLAGSPVGVGEYGRRLRRSFAALGLGRFGFGPHSLRAGWASEMRLRGMPIAELKERGRWASDSSLRVYLDQISAASISLQLPQVDVVADFVLADFVSRWPWWPARPAARPAASVGKGLPSAWRP